jgi:beta-lactamase class A
VTVAALTSRIEEIAGRAAGVVGVAATHLRTGRHVGFNEDLIFPTASVIKVPVLVALYREARAGRVDLRARLPLRHADRVAGSGVLQDLDEGLAPTVRDLAVLMITVSDNTATDLILRMVPPTLVERTMAELGLSSVRMPMTIRELLYEMVDMDPAQDGGYDENRRRLRLALGSGGRAIDPEATDRASPRDICRLFEMLESRAILDRVACDQILDICQRQKLGEIIPARLPLGTITARKTGSLRGVRNDAGIVYAPTGPYAVAIFSRGLPDVGLGTRALADLSLALYEEFRA